MKDCDLITLLSVFVLLSLIGAIATKMSEINDILPGFSADVFLTESFVAPVGAPRASGNLLDGKAAAAAREAPRSLTSEECFERDFAAQSEKTGNLAQWTNNYEHDSPESCTATVRRAVYS